MQNDLCIRFWGVRGSYPVPGPDTVRFGGNTACVEVQAGPHTIILDAGTGIIKLGADILRRAAVEGSPSVVVTLFFTHMHHDHTLGFPFFGPAYLGSSTLHIFGPKVFETDLEEALSNAMLPPNFPLMLHELPSVKILRTISAEDRIVLGPDPAAVQVVASDPAADVRRLDEVEVRVLHSYAHPRDGVHMYRISWRGTSVVYATDTEGYAGVDQRLVEFARGTDVLIHDAQYRLEDYADARRPKQGWGHSVPAMVCAVAEACGARQLVLFHHEPTYDDATVAAMEAEAQHLFPQVVSAYEGMEVRITDAEPGTERVVIAGRSAADAVAQLA
jgi:phosphoribosyl 1,2-cyclic phosphodiesterase